MTETTFDILLVEDNPGDARLIEEMVRSAAGWDQRIDDLDEAVPGRDDGAKEAAQVAGAEIRHVDRLEAGLEALEEETVDVVLLDLNLPESRGLDTLDAVVEHAPSVPVVVLTGMADQNLGLSALEQGAHEYLVKDEVTDDLLVRTIFHAAQRQRFEAEIERQRERLATLNDISMLVHGIAGSLIDHDSADAIEAAVCERLAGSSVYTAAWIGGVDQSAGEVVPRTAQVPAGFFDGWSVPATDDGSGGPTVGAARDGEVGAIRHADASPAYGEWREHARTFGYRSTATVPVLHNGVLYGILFVYSDRPAAFEDEELGIVRQLGNVVGHAINAVEQRAALMGDTSNEIELLLPGVVDGRGPDARIDFQATVPAGDGAYLQYAEVEGYDPEALDAVMGQFDSYESTREIDADADRRLVEIRYSEPPIVSRLASFGGRFKSATVVGDDYRITVELAGDADVRGFVEAVREAYPRVDLVAQRSVERGGERDDAPGRSTTLTEKQRAALESAYYSGYFDRPRTSTGEEVADSLGISPSTLHQHLQAGLRKVLSARFEGGSARRDGATPQPPGERPFGDD